MPLQVALLLIVALASAALGWVAGRWSTRVRCARPGAETSLRDPLTGLPNRAALLEVLGRQLALADRLQHPVTVMVVELDGWSTIVHESGADGGAQVIQTVAQRLLARVRAHDVLGRWSDGRFLLVLPGSDVGSALVLAQDLRESLSQQALRVHDRALEVTISIGLHGRAPSERERLQDHVADLAVGAERALEASVPDGPNRIGIEP